MSDKSNGGCKHFCKRSKPLEIHCWDWTAPVNCCKMVSPTVETYQKHWHFKEFSDAFVSDPLLDWVCLAIKKMIGYDHKSLLDKSGKEVSFREGKDLFTPEPLLVKSSLICICCAIESLANSELCSRRSNQTKPGRPTDVSRGQYVWGPFDCHHVGSLVWTSS